MKKDKLEIDNTISEVWQPSVQLRWVDCKKANKETNAVRFSNDIGFGWPDNIVLQQLHTSNLGNREWKDVPIETTA